MTHPCRAWLSPQAHLQCHLLQEALPDCPHNPADHWSLLLLLTPRGPSPAPDTRPRGHRGTCLGLSAIAEDASSRGGHGHHAHTQRSAPIRAQPVGCTRGWAAQALRLLLDLGSGRSQRPGPGGVLPSRGSSSNAQAPRFSSQTPPTPGVSLCLQPSSSWAAPSLIWVQNPLLRGSLTAPAHCPVPVCQLPHGAVPVGCSAVCYSTLAPVCLPGGHRRGSPPATHRPAPRLETSVGAGELGVAL